MRFTVWVEPDKSRVTKEKNPAARSGLNAQMIEIHRKCKSLEFRALLCLSYHGLCIKPLDYSCELTLNPELKKTLQYTMSTRKSKAP
jgi:hypothetical protein